MFVPKPIKGPSIIALGNGPVGSAATTDLVGLSLGPNIVGTTALAVNATGVHNGTIAGVYGDTGVFYSTDPKTVLGSFAANGGYDGNIGTADNLVKNNSGDLMVPVTQWDAEQLLAFGSVTPAAPIVDSNGRGNSPWGLASGVAGPESGYAWSFNRGYYLANPGDPSRMKNSIEVGPWKRIQYPGSQASKDQPGLVSSTIGYVGVDASNIGVPLSPATPLPPTLNWTDTTSPKAVRFSYGVLELNRPEFARVRLKILAGPGQPNSPFTANGCFTMTTDAFGGDAGGEQGGKDHLWRYYNPTLATIDTCALVQKVFSKPFVSPGETFSFQLQLINSSSVALTNVTLSDAMPAGLTYLSASPAPNTTAPLTWTFPIVPPNSLQIITVNVRASGSGTIFNTVTLTSDQESGSYRDSVEIVSKAQLSADKSVTPSTAAPGSTVTYTLTMTNDGTAANGTPLVITENLPAGFTFGTLTGALINGAPAAAGVVIVNSTDPAKPLFSISQGIQAGKTLVLTFTSVISATQTSGTYGNSVSFNYEGKTLASGSLAPVTVGGARIGDTVFRDWDGDGVRDPQDEGLTGVTVQLFASDGTTLLQTKTTDASGAYLFSGLTAGTYVVKTSGLPAGYTQTFDADGLGSANQSTVTVIANGENLAQDFGYKPGGTGSIGDLVFKDIGNDGTFNGTFNGTDAGIAGITVNLYEDTNGNGVLDAATDALVATTSTNGSGIYSFTGLATGISYLVDVDETDPELAAAFNPNTFLASTPALQAVPNLAGSYLNGDFGYFENQPSSIGDTMFEDVNRDGVYTPGTDSPLGNVTVSLYRDVDSNGRYDAGTDTLVGTTVTAADGTYIFGALGPGRYAAVVDGNDADVPDQLAAGVGEGAVTLSPGQNFLLADFPFVSLLNKSVNLASAVAGNSLTYTLVPSYPGDTPLAGLLISDTIPAGTTYTSVSQNGTFINDIVNDPPLRVEWDLGSNVAGTVGIFTASGSTTTVNFPAVDDSYVDATNTTTNFGAATTFNARGKQPVQRGYLKFNTSSLPTGVTITASALSLVRTGGTNNARAVGAYRVNGAWTEGVITWANQPAFTAAPETSTSVAGNGTYTWNLLALTQAWYTGSVSNNGVMLAYTGTNKDTKTFGSEENTAAGNRPNLAVTYVTLGGQYTRVTLASSPALVSGTTPQQVTVTMTIETVGNTATGVLTPPANLTVNNVGANTVAKLSGPTPATANVPIGGNTTTFTYVYNVTPGATPGSVSFTGKPASSGAGFPAFPTTAQVNNGTSDTTLTSPPLTFQVSVNTPPGVNVITNTATIGDAGVIPVTASNPAETATSGSIGDFVWFDADGDGVQDVGETEISGVRVFIDQNGDGQYNVGEPTDTTDTAGRYRIYGLGAGTYTVRYDYSTVPSRYIPTTALSHITTITGGQQYSLADFGLRSPASAGPLGSIGDTVWLDSDEDGLVDGDETLLPNVTVRLYRDANSNGTFEAASDLIYATTTSGANGAYSFTGLPAGTYFVDADEADTDLQAGIELVSGGANLATTRHTVVLAAGQIVTTADFGYNYAGSIGDTLFYDDDKDGVHDIGETGVPNATVLLYGETNGNGSIDVGEPILYLATTNSSGVYLFDNLPPGQYIVKADEQTVLAPPTSPNAGQPNTMQGTTGTKRPETLAPGQDHLTADIGFAEVAKIEGHVFHDVNGNGVLDPGETRLPNVTVTLSGTDELGAPVSLTTTTNATGEYKFIVPAGTYTVSYNTADPDIPAPLGSLTTATSFLFPVLSGMEVEDLDFGRDNTGTVGDLVWSDVDGDGVRDAGEPGIGGVAVALYADAGFTTLLASTVTSTSGAYLFAGLADGTYYVQVQSGSLPSGYSAVPTGDPDASKDGQGTATVAGGGNAPTMDFGYRPAGTVRSVSGVIFNDLNTNGAPNVPGEQLAGVTVTAAIDTDNDNVADLTFSTTTEANGAYSFLGIPDGADVVITVGTLPSTALVQTVDPDAMLNGNTRVDNLAANVTGVNFGYVEQLGSIVGTVVRGNGNGLADVGESPLSGVTITLLYAGSDGILGTADDVTRVTTTNASGDYTFTGLLPGAYQITETNPANHASLADADGGNADVISTALAVGQNKVDQDFEDAGTYVTGHLYLDSNGNGTQEVGEPNLPNVDVVISDALGGTQTVSTDANGNWSALVPAGSTTANVREADPQFPAGAIQTEGTEPTTVVTVLGTSASAGNDGYLVSATVTGHLYFDTNGNGVQNVGEPNLSDVDVVVTDSNGTMQTVFTNANGDWTATVPPGNTTANVSETDADFIAQVPVGYTQTEGTDPTSVNAVGGATTSAGNDSYYLAAIVNGHLYFDTNGNGFQDGAEPNLANVDVVITDSTGATQTVSTNAAGNWAASVPPGSTSANVSEADADFIAQVPAGYTQTEGTDPTTVTAVAGANTNAGIDGYYLAATVSGHLYFDTNGNGVQNAGEPNLTNVDVVITNANGTVLTVSTDANGDWSASIPPGTTSANVNEADADFIAQVPTGYTQTEGTDPTTVTAGAGANTSAGNDGYYIGTTVTGHLYFDTNGNGTQDGAEPNLVNVDVVVTDVNGVAQTVSTNAGGNWTAVVPPGSTTADVSETDADFIAQVPAGYVQTEGTDPNTVTAVSGGVTSAGNDGYYLAATVTGHLYFDTNGNGVQDGAEMNLTNIDVVITNANGTTQTVTTDAFGNWSAIVPPGTTTANVNEADADFIAQVPTGYAQTEGTDPTTVTAIAGASTSAGNDGYFLGTTVTGHLYFDTNGNGTQDGTEPNLANVDVVITDSNGVTTTVSTNAGGDWMIIVPPGATIADVNELDPSFAAAVPAGYTQTEGNDPTTVIAVAGTANDAGNDGYYLAATVTGHLYFDTNGNGLQDGVEPNLANVDVFITNATSSTQIVVTNAAGNWSASVPSGTTAADVNEADADFIAQVPTGYSQIEGTDPTSVTAVAGASTSAGNDGYYIGTAVTGHLYFDTNGDGTQNGSEPNLANVEVAVTDSNSVLHLLLTNAAGDWAVTVPPGSTTANVNNASASFMSQVPAGSTQTEGNDPTTIVAVLGAANFAGNDGYYLPATVSGHLYFDTNGNGVQNVGEPNLANVDVVTTDAKGIIQTVSTNAVGNWSASVPPGTTSADVSEVDPDFGAQVPGGYSQTEGNDPTTVTAVAGVNTSAGNDGYYVGTTVTGNLYIDTNGNGVQDTAESNLANVDVVVTDVNGVTQIVSTNANGDWTAIVPPGSTVVDVDETDPSFTAAMPVGYTRTEGTEPTTVIAVAGVSTDAGNDGYFLAATVTGHLYFDTNGNGVQDGAEPNISNLDVVVTNVNGITQTVSTNAAGNWSASVPPGATIANVSEADPDFTAQVPAGYSQTDGSDPTSVTAVAGATTSAGNDGYYIGTAVTGHLYFDTNGNGVQNPGEPNLVNVGVIVTDSNGATQTVFTDSAGDWTTIVPPGSTTANVNEASASFMAQVPAGYVQTKGTDPTTIAAASGVSTSAGIDGYYLAATVNGHLYFDTNGNGVQNPGEPNLANVDVVVLDANGSVQTASTNASGNWSASIPPGATTANVSEADPDFSAQVAAGYSQTEGTDPTTVTAVAGATTSAGIDGYYVGTTVTGHLYIDRNGNGVQDGSEPNLVNVDVVVTDVNGITQVVSTNASGDWTAIVPPGTTTVDVDESDPSFTAAMPAGYTRTEGTEPTTVVAVAGVNTDAGNDGYYLTATVAGHLYLDTNGKGVQDGAEPNLANVDVVITNANGVPQTVSTNANGNWTASVPPGTTIANVDESDPQFLALVPGGYTQTEGTDPTTVTAVAGATTSAGNDGYLIPATVTRHLYVDTNGNGTQQVGEPNIANVNVVIVNANGASQTVVTDANGNWTATVPPGNTTANVDELDADFIAVVPAGYTQTEGTDPTSVVAVANVSTSAGIDGYFNPATVTGHLYVDTNGSGTQQVGEPNIAAVNVVIVDANGVTQSVVTDANGNWTAVVPLGNTSANVDELDVDFIAQVPAGYVQTEGADPTAVVAVANVNTSADNDGYYIPATMTGHLYVDTNGNGTQQIGEPIFANVNIVITDANGAMQTIVTDANGNWTATVPPGHTTAIVDELDAEFIALVPAGYTRTEGTDPTSVVAVANVSTSAGIDGYYNPATVTGHLYVDTNGNSTQQVGEPNIANVNIVITDANGATQTVVTDANGNWTATLPPGATSADIDNTDPDYIAAVPATAVRTEGTDPTTVTAVANVSTSAGNNGFFIPATVTGHLYVDTNGNGTQDVGEPDIPNVNVIVTNSLGAPQTVVTDASGNWTATVPPGSTTAEIDETDPDFVAVVPPTSTQSEGTNPFTVLAIADSTISTGNAGFALPPAALHTISGVVFNDSNANNNAFDVSDTPIGNVMVALFRDVNGNGTAEPGEFVASEVTAVDGSYLFPSQPDGAYLVVETNPAGAISDLDSDGPANTNDLVAVALAGANVEGVNFLDDGITLRSISGSVTDGTNPIPGVLITLRSLAGDIIAAIPTKADGSYFFTNLSDGSYTATETNPIGVTGGSDVDGGNADVISTTIVGADVLGRNFVDTIPFPAFHKISGIIYKDAAANNDTFDPLDATIANVTVLLFRDVNGDGVPQFDEEIASAVSDVHGEYTFPFLPDAAYLIVAVNPAGASSDADADGTANTNDRIAVTLAGADFSARNFLKDGLVISSIGGVVSDGVRGIVGVILTLLNSNGDIVGSITTDQDGSYNFTGLPNGDYTVVESNPPGTIAGSDSDAGDPDVTLVSLRGVSFSAVNFFNLIPASIDPRTIYGYCTTPLMVNALRNLPRTSGSWTIVSLSKPRFGSVSIRPNGFVLYRPRANFGGRDSFIVTLTDGTSTIQKQIIIKDFTALKGTFQGLLTSGVTTRVAAPAAAEGCFTITLTDSAKFTAKLNLNSETIRFAGTLTGALRFEKNIRLRDGRTALLVLLYDDLRDTWNVTTSGDITLSSAVPIPRALKSAKSLAGRYTSAFIPEAPAGNQSSVGFGAISVAKNGAANVVGRLAGGKAFTMSARIAADGRAQYFLSGNTFTLIGAIDFTGAQVSPTGNLTWSYSAADSTPASVSLDVKGSRYVAPVGKTSAIGGATPLRFELRDNAGSVLLDVASPNSPSLLIGEQSGQKVTLKMNPTNGLATGEFTDSRTAERCILYGIIIQSEACVEGISDSQVDPLTAWTVDTR